MEYYLYKNDQNIGPLPESTVVAGMRNGRFSANDLGCRVGDSDWKDLSFFFPLETSTNRQNQPIVCETPPRVLQQTQRIVHEPVVIYQPAPAGFGQTSDIGKMMMYESNKKSTGIAYLLWFFLGMFGAHRFYLGKTGSGVAILLITICSLALKFVLIGFLTIFISIIWVLVDIALIPAMVQAHNNRLASRLNIYN